jgi:hypothetical protein
MILIRYVATEYWHKVCRTPLKIGVWLSFVCEKIMKCSSDHSGGGEWA